jgi:hypothetical protein
MFSSFEMRGEHLDVGLRNQLGHHELPSCFRVRFRLGLRHANVPQALRIPQSIECVRQPSLRTDRVSGLARMKQNRNKFEAHQAISVATALAGRCAGWAPSFHS